MELTPKITPFQFFTILFLSRVFAMVTYITSLRTQLTTTDEVTATLVMGAFLLITAIPTAIFLKKDNTSSIITRASVISELFAKILCVFFLIDYLYFGIITSVRFGIFTGSVMFPDTNVTFFVAIMIATSAYIAFKGIEAMGRSAVIILIPVLSAIIFVFSTQIKDFDMLNFTSPFSDGVRDIFSSGIYTASRTGELAFVTLLAPYMKNQKPKHVYTWLCALIILIFITEIMISGILGNYGGTQLFNMYSMSVLAQMGFIERMDAIITCMWLLCAGVKISVTIFLCETLLSSFFGKRRQIIYIAVSSFIIFAASVPLSNNIVKFASLIRSPLAIIFYIANVCIFPIAVMLGEKLKRRRKIEKA